MPADKLYSAFRAKEKAMSVTVDYNEPHEFRPGQCAGCGLWHTNPLHEPVNVLTAELRAKIRRNNESAFRRRIVEIVRRGPRGR